MVICPNCGKNTPEGKFCEQCGASISAPPPDTQHQVIPGSQKTYATNYIPVVLLILGVLFIFVNPVLLLIIVIISAIVVYTDAKSIGVGTQPTKELAFTSVTWKPISWAVLVFFFWIIFLPFYLIKRKELFSLSV